MKKMTSKTRNRIFILILVLAGLAALSLFLYDYFGHNKSNTEVTTNGIIPPQKSDIVFVNDSLRALQQEILISSDKAVIASLQDSLQRLINKKAGLKPEILLQYTSNFKQGELIGTYKDSLSKVIDGILASNMERDSLRTEILRIKSLTVPYTITDNKWRFESGTLNMNGKITSDSLRIVSRPLISFGEKTGFLKRPKLTVTIGDENPFITNTNATSYQYVPKRKVEFSATGIAATDGNSIYGGAGINVKKGILSFTVGYIKKAITFKP